MKMKDLSPKAEPISWATAVGLIVAAAVSYGLNITPELRDALVGIVPILAGLWWARSQVTAPDTLEQVKLAEFEAGQAAVRDATPPARSVKPKEGVARYTNVGR